jgi:hypothetical protein
VILVACERVPEWLDKGKAVPLKILKQPVVDLLATAPVRSAGQKMQGRRL